MSRVEARNPAGRLLTSGQTVPLSPHRPGVGFLRLQGTMPGARRRGGTRTAWMDRTGWRRGAVVSGVRRMNEVNARRARLVPGWVTVFGRVYHLGM